MRGTAAAGTIGPDLTHVGEPPLGRHRHAAADAGQPRALHPDGQHIKPGNRMPEFRIFAADEHDALAAYLLSLR